jgi:hypothetical protein
LPDDFLVVPVLGLYFEPNAAPDDGFLVVLVLGLGFGPNIMGFTDGGGVASTTAQLMDCEILELPHVDITYPIRAREPKGISPMNWGSLEDRVKKSEPRSIVEVRPSEIQTAYCEKDTETIRARLLTLFM